MARMVCRTPVTAIAFGALIAVAGCDRTVEIVEIGAFLSSAGELDETLTVAVSTGEDIRRLADARNIALVGELHICGQNEDRSQIRFVTVRYMDNANNESSELSSYRFQYPSRLERQTAMQRNQFSKEQKGWPRGMVEERGVCIQIVGCEMFGPCLKTPIVKVIEAERLLLK